METVFCLEWGANDYDQHGDYTLYIWATMPTFHVIKALLDDTEHCGDDAFYGRLSKGQSVDSCGDSYIIAENKLGTYLL